METTLKKLCDSLEFTAPGTIKRENTMAYDELLCDIFDHCGECVESLDDARFVKRRRLGLVERLVPLLRDKCTAGEIKEKWLTEWYWRAREFDWCARCDSNPRLLFDSSNSSESSDFSTIADDESETEESSSAGGVNDDDDDEEEEAASLKRKDAEELPTVVAKKLKIALEERMLWLVEWKEWTGYDVYISFVVCCETEAEARNTYPGCQPVWDGEEWIKKEDIDKLAVTKLGVALPETPQGLVHVNMRHG